MVCYGYSAAYAFWLLALDGHRQVRILNASRATWIDKGRPMSTDRPSASPTAYRLGPDPGMRAGREEVAAAVAEQDRVIVDVRSVPEYLGERFWPSGATQPGGRAGHVPGAVLIPIEQALEEDGSYKGAEDLRAVYEQAGVRGDRAVVTYCTVGGRASQTWFVLRRLLGFEGVAVCDGSWAGWGRGPEAPGGSWRGIGAGPRGLSTGCAAARTAEGWSVGA